MKPDSLAGNRPTAARMLTLAMLLVAFLGCGAAPPPPFDSARALEWVDRQVAHGPRIPGTPAHSACAIEIEHTLRGLADDVRVHKAEARGVPLTNVIAAFRPDADERIFLMAHWDTRPSADEDPDPARRNDPVPGANDGASGTAVLLEIARLLADTPPPRGVDLFFVDGEDGGEHGDPSSWCLGSRALASALTGYRPRMGILVDMVGDADLRLPMEQHSLAYAGKQTRWIWSLAAGLGESAFVELPGPAVTDDHLPFLEIGIPTVDLIDLDYAYWHTVSDTPDKVSAESLESVGRVLLAALFARDLPE